MRVRKDSTHCFPNYDIVPRQFLDYIRKNYLTNGAMLLSVDGCVDESQRNAAQCSERNENNDKTKITLALCYIQDCSSRQNLQNLRKDLNTCIPLGSEQKDLELCVHACMRGRACVTVAVCAGHPSRLGHQGMAEMA